MSHVSASLTTCSSKVNFAPNTCCSLLDTCPNLLTRTHNHWFFDLLANDVSTMMCHCPCWWCVPPLSSLQNCQQHSLLSCYHCPGGKHFLKKVDDHGPKESSMIQKCRLAVVVKFTIKISVHCFSRGFHWPGMIKRPWLAKIEWWCEWGFQNYGRFAIGSHESQFVLGGMGMIIQICYGEKDATRVSLRLAASCDNETSGLIVTDLL
jgi:hypothetical protein